MDALVVVESVFGNTRMIADAVAAGLGEWVSARVVDIGADPTQAAHLASTAALVVVGGPTHVFGMTRPATRRSAAQEQEPGTVPAAVGLREWLDGAVLAGRGRPAAAFDTRMGHVAITGSASRGAARKLLRRGFQLVGAPMGFAIDGMQGPLVVGELDRARAWGADLATALTGAGPQGARRPQRPPDRADRRHRPVVVGCQRYGDCDGRGSGPPAEAGTRHQSVVCGGPPLDLAPEGGIGRLRIRWTGPARAATCARPGGRRHEVTSPRHEFLGLCGVRRPPAAPAPSVWPRAAHRD